jgi:imidazolonepropionase-like amidohydrolase
MRLRSVRAFVAVLSAGAIALPATACGRADTGPSIAVTHVAVVDGSSAEARLDQNVIIRGNRIEAVGPASSTRVPRGAFTIDGRDRWLIPGLWDMHVHTTMPGGDEVLSMYIANGVTGVRDMAGDLDTLNLWRREIAAGTRIGPRMIASGPYLEGGDVPIPHLLVRDPADAEAAVDSLIALGVDFIKVHSQLTRESWFAIARAARSRGFPFAGHVPRSVGAAAASDSGARSIEHLLAIPNACAPAELKALAPRFSVQGALGGCDTTDLSPLFAKFVRNDTWVVPTLVAQLEVARWPRRDLPGDSVGQYLPQMLKDYVAGIFPMPDDVPAGADSVGLALFDKRVAITGALHRAGVHVMAGTDAPLRNSPPGFGLHDELSWFVRAGFSPLEALRAATLEPATFLGMQDSIGVVAPGMLADLVLLNADPLADIDNARRIERVVANGRVYAVRRTADRIIVEESSVRWRSRRP